MDESRSHEPLMSLDRCFETVWSGKREDEVLSSTGAETSSSVQALVAFSTRSDRSNSANSYAICCLLIRRQVSHQMTPALPTTFALNWLATVVAPLATPSLLGNSVFVAPTPTADYQRPRSLFFFLLPNVIRQSPRPAGLPHLPLSLPVQLSFFGESQPACRVGVRRAAGELTSLACALLPPQRSTNPHLRLRTFTIPPLPIPSSTASLTHQDGSLLPPRLAPFHPPLRPVRALVVVVVPGSSEPKGQATLARPDGRWTAGRGGSRRE